MDSVERLTLEAAQADTVLACEHRHRYEFATRLCAGLRVLDLCCGSGYGSAILASQARSVVGVDRDGASIEGAQAVIASQVAGVGFINADAVAFLRGQIAERFDVVVCFECLEHLTELDAALWLLRDHANRGTKVIASLPNSELFGERNPFHVTDFGYDEAMRAFSSFPSSVMLPQYLAEGSLICPPEAAAAEVAVVLDDRDEPAYANHFVFCVNFSAEAVNAVHHGSLQVDIAPVYNRWAEGLKHAIEALQIENARLARARLGKGASAGAAALALLADREAEVAALRGELEHLQGELRLGTAEGHAAATDHARPSRRAALEPALSPAPADFHEAWDDDPCDANSWERRRWRAATYLIPWLEQTFPLAGSTVLEYGCGDGPVSCAFGARAGRVLGLDIDGRAVAEGRRRAEAAGCQNVVLEWHHADDIGAAAAAHARAVDVVLLYAVLEHLSVAERLRLLRLAREVVKPNGVIVVCETPNRLIYFDHHTARMPFFHLLPDELAVEYYGRSARQEFTAAMEAGSREGPAAALETVVRWGRGVSFHEFEVVFGDLDAHVVASNYDPLLFDERPVHPDEVILWRYLARWRPDLAPVWSRYWLDLVLSPLPRRSRAPFIRPWVADTTASRNVGWTSAEALRLSSSDSELAIALPQPTGRVIVGVAAPAEQLVLKLEPEPPAIPRVAVAAPSCGQVFARFDLDEPADRLRLTSSGDVDVVFVGYEE